LVITEKAVILNTGDRDGMFAMNWWCDTSRQTAQLWNS